MAGVTAAGSFGEPLCDHIGHQIPAIGVAALAPRVKAHGLDDVAAFVGDKVSRTRVVGVVERFIGLALLLKGAAGFNDVKHAGHGSAPGDGVANSESLIPCPPVYLFGCLRFSDINKFLPVIGWVLFIYKNRTPFPIVRSGLYFYSLIEILSNTLYTPAECIIIQAGPLELESTTHGLSVPTERI